jgi:transposase
MTRKRSNVRRRFKVRRFTPEEHATFVKDFLAYVPVEEIAAKLNRSEGTLRARAVYFGLRRSQYVTKAMEWAPEHLRRRVHEMDARQWLAACYAWRDAERRKPKDEAVAKRAAQAAERAVQAAEIYRRSDITREQKMRLMRDAGLTYKEIAAHYNVTRTCVNNILMGGTQPVEKDRRGNLALNRKIIAAYMEGLNRKVIAARCNVTLSHAYQVIDQFLPSSLRTARAPRSSRAHLSTGSHRAGRTS